MDWLTDTARLRAFVCVADAASFTRAAEALGTSQPTVSTLVAALERRVGTPLFDRRRGAVTLTKAGAALLPRALEIMRVAEQATVAIDAATHPERRHLAIAGGEGLVTYTLPAALALLRRKLPGLTTAVIVGDETRVLQAVRSGEAQCGLVTDLAAPHDLVLEPYAEDELRVICAPGHALAGTTADLATIARHGLVVRDAAKSDRRQLEKLLAEAGVKPSSRLVVESLEAVKRCVEANLGVAFVPGVSIRRELAAGTLARVHTPEPLPTMRPCLAREHGQPAKLVELLLEALRAEG